MKTSLRIAAVIAVAAIFVAAGIDSQAAPGRALTPRGERLVSNGGLTPLEQLGKALFFDTDLSSPRGQSCAACHGPSVGFTGPGEIINMTTVVYPGAVSTRFGDRKPPASAYAGDSPVLYWNEADQVWVGGMFWDGRATGWTLGDALAEQAGGPFLNPLEQNMSSMKQVCGRVEQSEYSRLFKQVWGKRSLDCGERVAQTYELIARSIAAYERSAEVNPFSSKYDAWLAGGAMLTPQEESGRLLFEGKAMCAACHPGPLFTDFTYDNLGAPRNPANPFYLNQQYNPLGYDWVDVGLGGFLKNAGFAEDVYMDEWGKFKVPTLRNIDLRPTPGFVKAFGHNGHFKSLESLVHFYNTRDVLPTCMPGMGMMEGVDCWPAAEVAVNVNVDELGDLGLTPQEESDLVAFLATLSDGWAPMP